MFPTHIIAAKMGKVTLGVLGVGVGKVFFADTLPIPGSPVETSILTELIRQAPWAVALILLCWLFLRFMLTVMSENRKMIEAISHEHLEARRLTRDALEKVARTSGENAISTQRNSDMLERLVSVIEKQTDRINRGR